ncbi:TPA: hypothetical protein N0F65_010862 [Lagenidium giganteum]|uniref:DDE Tnp4 domain-containing protein n=1 Tax=Lagenidium giganteum TaxID=4803 RepID=A0AAV2Z695_9STRA|nr:TPA: hypothetical protein N0F65_010862 [Lagenidium giganteum]
MPHDERKYNYRHIGTRIVVEMAFGRLKNMFRIFQTPLLHDTPEKMAQIIKCSLVLHNWMIDLRSELTQTPPESWMYIGGDVSAKFDKVSGDDAKRVRDQVKAYVNFY